MTSVADIYISDRFLTDFGGACRNYKRDFVVFGTRTPLSPPCLKKPIMSAWALVHSLPEQAPLDIIRILQSTPEQALAGGDRLNSKGGT